MATFDVTGFHPCLEQHLVRLFAGRIGFHIRVEIAPVHGNAQERRGIVAIGVIP